MDTDVLIIGAGPTGVALGIALAQHGVSVILADKADGIYPLPRAAHIDHETMRILPQHAHEGGQALDILAVDFNQLEGSRTSLLLGKVDRGMCRFDQG